MIRCVVLILSFLLQSPLAASAGYEEGAAAIMRGDYAAGLSELRPAAEKGDVRAQVLLGDMYREQLGVRRDDSLAAFWYRKAAELGWAPAQAQLGHLYRRGEGVLQSHVEAAKWYRKAAEQNLTVGQVSLGATYYHGLGLARDYVQAHVWFTLALSGISVRDADLALARKGIAQAEAEMSPEQIKEAKRLAQSWTLPAPTQQAE